jgi:UDP-2-acetamido-3-amino-2,3-dideoxy-glucuronate N-acetyltransferase
MAQFFQHSHALVESVDIGEGTRIWAFAHVLKGAKIGQECNVGDGAFIEGGAVIGDRVTIKNNVLIWDGVEIEDDVFLGPAVVFTNDLMPRSPRFEPAAPRYQELAGTDESVPGGKHRSQCHRAMRRENR